MPLESIQLTDFRCLEKAELAFSSATNLIVGPNAAGKTSILEGIGYLGRGRSFRGAAAKELVRAGADEFVLFGRSDFRERSVGLGVRYTRSGNEIRVDGEKKRSVAALAECLPMQIIDPEVHELVAGGPDYRRRYIDWIAFHVEQDYLETWRQYRRALRQRNAALKDGASDATIEAWSEELASVGDQVDRRRRAVVDRLSAELAEMAAALLGAPIETRYHSGWSADRSLVEALSGRVARERQLGSTQFGPHRADLAVRFDTAEARKRVSRGQQKLLSCAMILTATAMVQARLKQPLVLLLDDPAAELDRSSQERLMRQVDALGCQVIATALAAKPALFEQAPAMFHVEQGVVSAG